MELQEMPKAGPSTTGATRKKMPPRADTQEVEFKSSSSEGVDAASIETTESVQIQELPPDEPQPNVQQPRVRARFRDLSKRKRCYLLILTFFITLSFVTALISIVLGSLDQHHKAYHFFIATVGFIMGAATGFHTYLYYMMSIDKQTYRINP